MANGLVVLSGRNRAIEESAVGDMVCYYENQKPEEMAAAIINMPHIEGVKKRLTDLDGHFAKSLDEILNK